MTVFADASALLAIIAAEADALMLAECLEGDQKRLYSALSGWETVAGLCRAYRLTVPQAQTRVRLFLTELGFRMVAIGEAEFALATEAYARFGKGRHPASLQHGRLLCLRLCESQPCQAAVQGR